MAYALPGGPLLLGGPVVSGFGRGSRQMGVPTANIDPAPLQAALADMPLGVYFGCATCAAVAFAQVAVVLGLPALTQCSVCAMIVTLSHLKNQGRLDVSLPSDAACSACTSGTLCTLTACLDIGGRGWMRRPARQQVTPRCTRRPSTSGGGRL